MKEHNYLNKSNILDKNFKIRLFFDFISDFLKFIFFNNKRNLLNLNFIFKSIYIYSFLFEINIYLIKCLPNLELNI